MMFRIILLFTFSLAVTVMLHKQGAAKDLPSHIDEVAPGNETRYGQAFGGARKKVYEFPDFNLVLRGKQQISAADIKFNEDMAARGITGGYRADSYRFTVIERAEKPSFEIQMELLPYSYTSFNAAGKQFTITPGAYYHPKNTFVIYQGDRSRPPGI